MDEELSNFLSYVANGEPVDAFTQELMKEVEKARTNKDWKVEYMGWMTDRQDAYNEGLEQGRIELQQEKIIKIQNMLKKNYSKEEILDIGYAEEEFVEAEKRMVK